VRPVVFEVLVGLLAEAFDHIFEQRVAFKTLLLAVKEVIATNLGEDRVSTDQVGDEGDLFGSEIKAYVG
jgi:hypothetical protein